MRTNCPHIPDSRRSPNGSTAADSQTTTTSSGGAMSAPKPSTICRGCNRPVPPSYPTPLPQKALSSRPTEGSGGICGCFQRKADSIHNCRRKDRRVATVSVTRPSRISVPPVPRIWEPVIWTPRRVLYPLRSSIAEQRARHNPHRHSALTNPQPPRTQPVPPQKTSTGFAC
jgi:hypothetical protein